MTFRFIVTRLWRNPLPVGRLGGAAALAVLLAGCGILAPATEKAARARAEKVSLAYRPGELKLPELKAGSPFDDYLKYALLNNPDVQAAYFDWHAGIERITVARSLPDPRLTFQMDIQNGIPSVMPGLQFDLPGPGKLTAAANIAAAGSDAQYYTFVRICRQTAFNLASAGQEILFLDRKQAILQESLQLMNEIEELAQGLNLTNQATIQDVLRAQIEQEKRRTEIRNLTTARQVAEQKFRAALGGTDWRQPLILPEKYPALPVDPAWNWKFLQDAYAHSPELRILRAEIVRAEASLDLAYKGNIPDFSAGAEMDALAAPILVRPMASMTLPIWREKIAAAIAAAQADRQAAGVKLSARKIALAVEFAEKSYLIKEAVRNLESLHSQLLPKAQMAVLAARGAYAAGKVDFQTVLDAERSRLNLEVEEAAMQFQHEVAVWKIYLLVAGQYPGGNGGASLEE